MAVIISPYHSKCPERSSFNDSNLHLFPTTVTYTSTKQSDRLLSGENLFAFSSSWTTNGLRATSWVGLAIGGQHRSGLSLLHNIHPAVAWTLTHDELDGNARFRIRRYNSWTCRIQACLWDVAGFLASAAQGDSTGRFVLSGVCH